MYYDLQITISNTEIGTIQLSNDGEYDSLDFTYEQEMYARVWNVKKEDVVIVAKKMENKIIK